MKKQPTGWVNASKKWINQQSEMQAQQIKIEGKHMIRIIRSILLAALLALTFTVHLHAQGTAFTYQGRLSDSGNPANGTYDFQFRLALDPMGSNYLNSAFVTNAVPVSNGLFTATMDFGNVFNGSNYWLEVDVRTNGAADYIALKPLQVLTPTPYAIMANSASNLLGKVPATQLSGTIATNSLPADADFGNPVWMGANSAEIMTDNASPMSSSLLYGTDGTGWEFGIGKDQLGAITYQLTLHDNGDVNVGSDPNDRLSVNGAIQANNYVGANIGPGTGVNLEPGVVSTLSFYSTSWRVYAETPGIGEVLRVTRSGNVGIGTTAPQAKLDVAGTTRTEVLQITGGSDLAEPFKFAPTDQKIRPGSVVIIDAKNPGRLKLSDKPYDPHVAGVVSGAKGIHPGIQMRQLDSGIGSQNVALTGRVYVLATAANGPIRPGDLLTTSSTPGYAMKVTNHTRAQGAILGKAMTSLSRGKGMVLVLVSLQ